MNGNYLFDTNAVVYYLQGRPAWVDFIENANITKRSASVITRMELLSYPGIESDEEDGIRRFFEDLIVVPLNETIENAAITLRRATCLKLPDAIIAATAIVLKATIITGDQHLSNLAWPDLHVVNPGG